jgi:hypothetical protein
MLLHEGGVWHGALRVHVTLRVHVGEHEAGAEHCASLDAQVVHSTFAGVCGRRHVQEVATVYVADAFVEVEVVEVEADVSGEHLAVALVQ